MLGWVDVLEVRPGWDVRCHPLAARFSYAAQSVDPEQRAEFDAFINSCSPGMGLLDAGAHFGLFSLAALHYGGPTARAVAIDPSPIAARVLHAQIRLNGVADRVALLRAAAGEAPGHKAMLAAGVLGAFYYTSPDENRPSQDLTDTTQVTLDGVAETCGFEVSHLKVDVEGAEAETLRGARSLLSWDRPPLVFLEMHNQMVRERGGMPDATIATLSEAGYSLHSLDGTALSVETALSSPLIRVIAAKPSHKAEMAAVRSA
jgi:FkbM family methyltransferase